MSFSTRIVSGLCVFIPLMSVNAQDSSASRSGAPSRAVPVWADSMRYGGGPSIGAPPSDFMGKAPPTAWCLKEDGRPRGDFGNMGMSWRTITRVWLRRKMSDTSETGWRKIVGGAPHLSPTDSIIEVQDERMCARIAEVVHRDVLGFEGGPPPIIAFRVRDFLFAYPSNAHRGEFGYAIGMSSDLKVRGVVTW